MAAGSVSWRACGSREPAPRRRPRRNTPQHHTNQRQQLLHTSAAAAPPRNSSTTCLTPVSLMLHTLLLVKQCLRLLHQLALARRTESHRLGRCQARPAQRSSTSRIRRKRHAPGRSLFEQCECAYSRASSVCSWDNRGAKYRFMLSRQHKYETAKSSYVTQNRMAVPHPRCALRHGRRGLRRQASVYPACRQCSTTWTPPVAAGSASPTTPA